VLSSEYELSDKNQLLIGIIFLLEHSNAVSFLLGERILFSKREINLRILRGKNLRILKNIMITFCVNSSFIINIPYL
jgi:hypothetical protein